MIRLVLALVALLFAIAPATAGSAGLVCARMTQIEPMIECWGRLYPGLTVHETTEAEKQQLITRNTVGNLDDVSRIVWLYRGDHRVVFIIMADDVGGVIRKGRLPLNMLHDILNPSEQSMLHQIQMRSTCLPYATAVSKLARRFGEHRIGRGAGARAGSVHELYVAETGSWTFLVTRPNGIACIAAAGEGWVTSPPLVGKGA